MQEKKFYFVVKLLNIQAVFFSDIFIENAESEKFCLYLKLSKRFGLFGQHVDAIFKVNVFLVPGAKVETAIAREYLWFRRVICKILGHHSTNNLESLSFLFPSFHLIVSLMPVTAKPNYAR